ncbi:MAG TPA: hypothetical protein VGK59_23840 [Ohtaekwangia sp.]
MSRTVTASTIAASIKSNPRDQIFWKSFMKRMTTGFQSRDQQNLFNDHGEKLLHKRDRAVQLFNQLTLRKG